MKTYKYIYEEDLKKQQVLMEKAYNFFEKRIDQLSCNFIMINDDDKESLRIALIDTINLYDALNNTKHNKNNNKGE